MVAQNYQGSGSTEHLQPLPLKDWLVCLCFGVLFFSAPAMIFGLFNFQREKFNLMWFKWNVGFWPLIETKTKRQSVTCLYSRRWYCCCYFFCAYERNENKNWNTFSFIFRYWRTPTDLHLTTSINRDELNFVRAIDLARCGLLGYAVVGCTNRTTDGRTAGRTHGRTNGTERTTLNAIRRILQVIHTTTTTTSDRTKSNPK